MAIVSVAELLRCYVRPGASRRNVIDKDLRRTHVLGCQRSVFHGDAKISSKPAYIARSSNTNKTRRHELLNRPGFAQPQRGGGRRGAGLGVLRVLVFRGGGGGVFMLQGSTATVTVHSC